VQIFKKVTGKFGRYFLIIFGAALVAAAGFFLWQKYGWERGVDFSCVKIEEHNIAGASMDPLLVDGQRVKGLVGYYDCNPIERDQIAVLAFQTREELFVKRIAGIGGDKLEFTDGEGQLKINGEIAKNSSGEPYLFSEASQRIITIPLKDGRIQEGRYLILSEEKGPNSFDSRQFGFAEKEHLKGRVIFK